MGGGNSAVQTFQRGDIYSSGITIDNTTILNTQMIVVTPEIVTISGNDANWKNITGDGYSSSTMKGVFYANRNVTLSPYAIGQYEVTQKLYESVMGINPSEENNGDNYPVDKMTWFDIINFCNKLTNKVLSEADCVYYSDESFTTPYESGDTVYIDLTKKGYRLPTEAEWEFAARGGDTSAEAWYYAFSGTNSNNDLPLFDTSKKGSSSTYYEYDTSGYLITDSNLDYYGVYSGNSSNILEVGKKSPNTLNLYDMSGNVYEYVNDDKGSLSTGDLENPITLTSNTSRMLRGGGYDTYYGAYVCCVTYRYSNSQTNGYEAYGFRLCQSITY